MPSDSEIQERIKEVIGELPCGDQGNHIIKLMRAGLVWLVIKKGKVVKSARFLHPKTNYA